MNDNVFEQFARNHKTENSTLKPVPEYAALAIDSATGRQTWLRLHQDNGIVHLIAYDDLIQCQYLPSHLHDDRQSDSILLHYHSDIIHIKGRNLLPAIHLLQTQKLAAIHVTRTGQYPANENKWPIVTHMAVQVEEEE